MYRAMIIQAIRNDPDWKTGEYTAPPLSGLLAAQYSLWMMTSSPLQLHQANPTREQPVRSFRRLQPIATPGRDQSSAVRDQLCR